MKTFKEYLLEVPTNIYFPIKKNIQPRQLSDTITINYFDELRHNGIIHPEDKKGNGSPL